jgi:translation initiation factor 2B subunit (eIF-2B alpha/beta/delta family)
MDQKKLDRIEFINKPVIKKKRTKNDSYKDDHMEHNRWLKSINKNNISLDEYVRWVKGRGPAFAFDIKDNK